MEVEQWMVTFGSSQRGPESHHVGVEATLAALTATYIGTQAQDQSEGVAQGRRPWRRLTARRHEGL